MLSNHCTFLKLFFNLEIAMPPRLSNMLHKSKVRCNLQQNYIIFFTHKYLLKEKLNVEKNSKCFYFLLIFGFISYTMKN